jgi:Uma2 family endonuclease
MSAVASVALRARYTGGRSTDGRFGVALPKTRMTLEEFLALPERKPALEFEDGVVTQKVSPTIWHAALQAILVELINGFARPRKLARAFPELRTAWTGISRVPDVSIYTWDRIRRDAEGKLIFTRVSEPPDIAIEILSPSQRTNAMIRRLLSFVAAGVRAAALVDPDDESVVVVRSNSMPAALRRGDTLDLSDIVPDLRLEIESIFNALQD